MRATKAGSFDELAFAYDRYRIGYAPELYDVLGEAGLAAGDRVLDVGCGTGLVTSALVQLGCDVVGVDVSEPMLERARARIPSARFVEASSEALPFDDDAFDVAVSAQAFHWFDQRRALAEMIRVVRPGGVIAIWWKGLLRGDTTRMMREATSLELGLDVLPDLLSIPFEAFERAPLDEPRLRIVPWRVPMTVDAYLGYESSRARARDTFGARLPEYYDRLRERLSRNGTSLVLSYVHHLYIGRVR